jgi:hypothetical protein
MNNHEESVTSKKLDKALLFATTILASCASGAVLYIIDDLHGSVTALEELHEDFNSRIVSTKLSTENNNERIKNLEKCCEATKDGLISLNPTQLEYVIDKHTERLDQMENDITKLKYECRPKDRR